MMSEQVNKEVEQQEEEDLPVPPAKGYNLDFLDNLDDPNFNPFETKTAIKNNFGTSSVVPPSSTAATATSAASTANDADTTIANDESTAPKTVEKKEIKRKPLTKRPRLKRPPVKTPVAKNTDPPTEEKTDGAE